MTKYCMEDGTLYRYEENVREAHYWDEATKTWEPCPVQYDDLNRGFYYEADDPHWIQTYREVSEESAALWVSGVTLQALALPIAQKAHAGQVDLARVPLINHLLFVASQMGTDEAKAVALLHDVFNKTDLTEKDLKDAGMPNAVIEAVKTLTQAKGESYQAYIDRIKRNPLATAVKIADLHHNCDLSRLSVVTDADRKRHAKYTSAMRYLAKKPRMQWDWETIYRYCEDPEDLNDPKLQCELSGAKYIPPQPKKPSKAQQKKAFREFLKHATHIPKNPQSTL